MAAKNIAYAEDARQSMLRGVNKLAESVKITLGSSEATRSDMVSLSV